MRARTCTGRDVGRGGAPDGRLRPLFFNDSKLLDDQYDFITCTEVVEHLHHAFDEFARFDRLLKPGGWLAVMTMFQTDDAAFAGWHYRRDPTHVVFYRYYDLPNHCQAPPLAL